MKHAEPARHPLPADSYEEPVSTHTHRPDELYNTLALHVDFIAVHAELAPAFSSTSEHCWDLNPQCCTLMF